MNSASIPNTIKALRDTADKLEALIQDKVSPTHKEKLLRHYAEGDSVLFAQFDGFTNCNRFDELMQPDGEGHCLMSTQAHELRRSEHSVRVQIRNGTSAKNAVILLQKILADVKSTAKHGGATAFTFADDSQIHDGFSGLDDSELPF